MYGFGFTERERPLLSKPGLAHLCVVTEAGNWKFFPQETLGALLERAEAPRGWRGT